MRSVFNTTLWLIMLDSSNSGEGSEGDDSFDGHQELMDPDLFYDSEDSENEV